MQTDENGLPLIPIKERKISIMAEKGRMGPESGPDRSAGLGSRLVARRLTFGMPLDVNISWPLAIYRGNLFS